jgi:hypothetical protein
MAGLKENKANSAHPAEAGALAELGNYKRLKSMVLQMYMASHSLMSAI